MGGKGKVDENPGRHLTSSMRKKKAWSFTKRDPWSGGGQEKIVGWGKKVTFIKKGKRCTLGEKNRGRTKETC